MEFRESFHIDVPISYLPFWEPTYPLPFGTFEDNVPEVA